MLRYQHFTNRKDRNIEDFDVGRVSGVERTEEGRMLIQNKCGVSSQNKQYEKRRGRCGRLVGHFTLPFLSGQLPLSGRTGSKQRLLQTIGRYS